MPDSRFWGLGCVRECLLSANSGRSGKVAHIPQASDEINQSFSAHQFLTHMVCGESHVRLDDRRGRKSLFDPVFSQVLFYRSGDPETEII